MLWNQELRAKGFKLQVYYNKDYTIDIYDMLRHKEYLIDYKERRAQTSMQNEEARQNIYENKKDTFSRTKIDIEKYKREKYEKRKNQSL